MKLISLTDYVLELWDDKLISQIGIMAINYAQFLKQKIKLEMFVPCDERGNLLEELSSQDFRTKFNLDYYTDAWQNLYKNYCIKHKEAKAKVLFDGFYVKNDDDGKLCLFHQDYEWDIATIEPNFVWGRTNEFTIEDIVNHNPKLSLFVLNENSISRLLQACC